MVTRSESKCASISIGAQGGGYGGLTADGERVIVRNGSTVVIRPLGAGDEAAIARWFAGLSAEARYARFWFLEQLIGGPSLRLRVWTTSIMRRSWCSPPTEPTVGIARYLRTGRRGAARSRLRWPTTGGGQASLACCSNGSQPGRVPSGSSHSP
jgi:hypothetical protein